MVVDGLRIRCPHGKMAMAKNVYGLITYEHLNGSSCALLNNFYVPVTWLFAKQILHGGVVNSSARKVILHHSKRARKLVYGQFSTADSDRLRRLLSGFMRVTGNSFIQELWNDFGEVVLDNLVELDLFVSREQAQPYVDRSVSIPRRGRLPMINLVEKRREGVVQRISSELDTTTSVVLKTAQELANDRVWEIWRK